MAADKLIEFDSPKNNRKENVVITSPKLDKAVQIANWVAYLNGVFPLQITLLKSVTEWKFKKLSFSYVISWTLFIVKCAVVQHVMIVYGRLSTAVDFESTYTDIIAVVLFSISSFFLGIVTHLLSLTGVRSMLTTFKAMYLFGRKYPTLRTLSFGYAQLVINAFISAVNIAFPPFMIWHVSQVGMKNEGRILISMDEFGISTEHDVVLIVAYILACLIFLEIGVIHMFNSILLLGQRMSLTLEELAVHAEVKGRQNRDRKFVMKAWVIPAGKSAQMKPEPQIQEARSCSWYEMSEAYLEFYDVFEKYERWVGCKLICLYLCFIAGMISTVYLMIQTTNPIMAQYALGDLVSLLFFMYRIHCLASSGEVISQKYERLSHTLVKINQSGDVSTDEEREFKKYLAIVKNAPIYLNAKGYFLVRKSNMTSITSVVLTYIIVLLQFRMTDHEKFVLPQ